jgi:hypothetical protein
MTETFRLVSALPLLLGGLHGSARHDRKLALDELERERRRIRSSFKPEDPMMQAYLSSLRLEILDGSAWAPVTA